MGCTNCGFENGEGVRFCVECGNTLALRCPSCTAEYQAVQKFCGECGTALTGAPAPTASGASAVRKTVTVLFADLGGSTGFGERVDPEISRQVLAQYHALLQAVIDDHTGTVAKFMGDGMMATFGIPEVAEDDARRAVDAGVAMQQRFHEFAAEIDRRYGETLTLRVGVNSGEVVIGDGDADLIGDALNVAARLEKACRPGHVLVGEETWRLTRGEVGYEGLGEVTVAGRAQPVAIYEVALEADATPDVATPFVGRDAEMQRLVDVFDDARRAETARLVTVLGSPGVGKTRLSRELCAHLADHADAQRVEIRCDRAGEATFAPVAQLIRDAAGLVEDLDIDAARTAIGTLLPHPDADHARVVDVLAGLVGVGTARSVEETFWGVRRLIEATAAMRPLVVVIDDIQWAEPLLLDLIEHLAEWVADAAVLIVGLARPELREVRPSLAEPGRPVAAVVLLDGLDAAATEALAAGLLGTDRLPAGLVERLPSSTDGNPLFVRELVRMLVDDHVIRRRDDGEWELTIDAEAVDVPPTIQSLLGARVERLPAAERELLEQAAVVGAEFSLGALRELAGARAAIVTMLETMRRKELVEPTGTYWGDEPVYRFHHVLIRDAAYRRLLKTARADLHERVAVWTDRTAAELVGEHETATAFHYEQAFRYRTELGTVDDDTVRLGRRAAELLTTAAQRALGRDDLASAGASSARALALLPESDASVRSDLLQMGCECLLASGDGGAAQPLVAELGRSSTGDPRGAAWAECFAAQLVGLTDPAGLVAADAQAQAAAEVLTELGDGSGQAKAHQVRAGLLARLGRVGDAELELDLALAAARAADDRRRVTAVLGAAPDAALFGPSPVARAGGRCLDVVRLLRITTASPAVEAASNRCQAVLEALRGRFDVSRSMLASARASLEELGLRHGLAQTELYAGMVELIAGNPRGAIAPLRAAYEGLGTLGVGADAGQAAALLATALLAEGEVDEAELMAAESEALAGQNLKTAIGWRIARAEVLAARGDLWGAVALAEEAVGIAAGTDLVIDHADACVALSDLLSRAGDAAGSRAARADAKRLYEQKGATVPAERLDEEKVPTPAPASRLRPPGEDPDSTVGGPVLENTASRVDARVVALLGGGSDRELSALIAPEFIFEDRRHVVNFGVSDLAGSASHLEWSRRDGFELATPEVVAVRGDRLVVSRRTQRTPAGDRSSVAVVEIDDRDRLRALVQFDEADLAAAIEELDARYVAGEGAEHASVVAALAAWTRAINGFDFDALRSLMSDDFTWVDHLQLGWGVLDAQAFFDQRRQYVNLSSCSVNAQIRVHGGVVLTVTHSRADGPDGGEAEWEFACVGVWRTDGRVERIESFDLDQWDVAVARFEELSGRSGPAIENAAIRAFDQIVSLAAGRPPGPRTPNPENAATRFLEQMRVALNDGDYETARRFSSSDFEFDDRRSIVAVADVDALIIDTKGATEQGFVIVEPEVVAVRGEQLCLRRLVYRTPAGDESPRLVLDQLGPDGRLDRSVFFDEGDVTAAQAELDRLYYFGEGTPFQRVLGAVARYSAAYEERDDEERLAPDFVLVDHQPLGFGDGDRDYFLEMERVDQTEGRGVNRVLYVNEHALLAVNAQTPISQHGSRYERSGCVVMGIDASDRVNRIEMYAEDDFAAALARLDELGATSRADPRTAKAENATTKLIARTLDLLNRGEWEALSAMNVAADGVLRFDRRRTISAPTLSDSESFGANAAAIYEVFGVVRPEPVAVRGERLALIRLHCGEPPAFTMQMLVVYELDDAGRIVREVDFDADALAAAIAELDERYVAGEGTDRAELFRLFNANAAAVASRDYAALAALTSPEFEFVDHRLVGWGTLTREGFADMRRGYDDLQTTVVVTKVYFEERALIARTLSRGVAEDGAEVEWLNYCVFLADVAGLGVRSELFDEDHWEQALTRFDEFAADVATSSSDSRTLQVDNAASRVARRVAGLFTEHRLTDMAALMHPDVVTESRRRVVGTPAGVTWDEVAGALSVQFSSASSEPIAVRGERLAANRVVMRDDADNLSVWIAAVALDSSGRILRMTNFDEEDEITAIDLLDEWYIGGEGAADAQDLTVGRDGMRRYHARDWDAMRAAMADGFELIDHHPLGWPLADADSWIRLMQERVAQVPDMRCAVRKIWQRDRVGLALIEVMGTDPEEGQFSWPSLQISGPLSTDGRNPRIEYFALDDAEAAFARLDELAGGADADRSARDLEVRTPEIDNAAARTIVIASRLLWSDLEAALDRFSPDAIGVARESGPSLGLSAENREMWRDVLGSFADTYDDVRYATVAVRGNRLALLRQEFVTDSYVTPVLLLVETDQHDQILRLETFAEEDLSRALDEIELRYARSGDLTRAGRQVLLAVAGLNHRRWDELDAVLAPNVAIADHRRIGFPSAVGKQHLVGALQALVGQVPDVVAIVRVIDVSGPAVRAVVDQVGTSADGVKADWSWLFVVAVGGDGKLARVEYFDPDDEDRARARFEELASC